MSVLQVNLLSKYGRLPTKGTEFSAGYDLYAAHNLIIPAGGKGLVKTDIAIAVPYGYYGRIAPRSGLSWKKHTDIGAGVIDADYRGNVGIVIFNHGQQDLEIECHDRVAQLIIEKIANPEIKQVSTLETTIRGDNGYGSTG